MGDLEDLLVWTGIVSAVALTWGVNHWMEDLPLCLSSLYIHLSKLKNKKNLTTAAAMDVGRKVPSFTAGGSVG